MQRHSDSRSFSMTKMTNNTEILEKKGVSTDAAFSESYEENTDKALPPDDCDGECAGCDFYGKCKDLCDDKEFYRLFEVITGKGK